MAGLAYNCGLMTEGNYLSSTFFCFQTKEYTAVELMDVYKVRKFAVPSY